MITFWIFGSLEDPEWIFENDENDEGGGQLKIYFLFFSAIVKIPGRGYPTLWGRVAPRGDPGPFFGLKLDLEFNGGTPRS